MSFDIHRFLEEIVARDLPNAAKHNAYLGVGVLAGGIEFLKQSAIFALK